MKLRSNSLSSKPLKKAVIIYSTNLQDIRPPIRLSRFVMHFVITENQR